MLNKLGTKKETRCKITLKKFLRSHTQALINFSRSMSQLAKRYKTLFDFEKERDTCFMQFKQEEAECHR